MYEIDEKCQKCKNNGTAICNRCDMFYDEFDPIDKPPKTNADRIRAMTDEELAEFLEMDRDCYRCILKCIGHDGKPLSRAACMLKVLDWLRQEAE